MSLSFHSHPFPRLPSCRKELGAVTIPSKGSDFLSAKEGTRRKENTQIQPAEKGAPRKQTHQGAVHQQTQQVAPRFSNSVSPRSPFLEVARQRTGETSWAPAGALSLRLGSICEAQNACLLPLRSRGLSLSCTHQQKAHDSARPHGRPGDPRAPGQRPTAPLPHRTGCGRASARSRPEHLAAWHLPLPTSPPYRPSLPTLSCLGQLG